MTFPAPVANSRRRCLPAAHCERRLSVFLSDILPIFLIAGVGYLLAKKLQASVKTLAHVVFYALIPCFVFKMLIGSKVGGPEAGRMALLAILVAADDGRVGANRAIPLRLNRSDLSGFLLVAMFSNGGNYGLPWSYLHSEARPFPTRPSIS